MKTMLKLWCPKVVFPFVILVTILWLILATVVCLAILSCSSTSTTPTTSGWTQTYGHNFTLKPAGSGFTFDFPQADGVHYITKESGSLKIGQTITVIYKITSGTDTESTESRSASASRERQGGTLAVSTIFKTVQANTGKPAFRLMIQKGSDMHTQFGRYWSDDEVILSGGVESRHAESNSLLRYGTAQSSGSSDPPALTFSVKITPELWSDVYGGKGTEHLAEFKDTLANCGHVGITFGGTDGGYGHGTYATGKATFTLVSMTIK